MPTPVPRPPLTARGRRRALSVLLAAVLLAPVGLVQLGASAPAGAATRSWSTSFEEAGAEGDGRAWPDAGSGVVGAVSDGSGAPGLSLAVDDGPDRAYAAKTDVGFTGLQALSYAGVHDGEQEGSADHLVADVDVEVSAGSELSYLVFPHFEEDTRDYGATFVAVDLVFDDGSRLSELGAEDQNGVPVTARAQGEADSMYPLQWNDRTVDLGEVAAGKTVRQVLLSYDRAGGGGPLRGWLDDVTIEGASDEPQPVRPSEHVVTTRGTHSNGTYSRGNNFPATAVPNGFNFWTPVTDAGSLSELYRYHEANNEQNLPEIQAFTASHQTSIWMGDRQTFQVMPSTTEDAPDPDREARALAFSHEDEQASPHHYAVTFGNGLRTDVAPTDHAAMFRFTFPEEGGRHLVLDNVTDAAGLTIDAEAGTLSGWSETRTISTGATRMFMYAELSEPVSDAAMVPEGHRPSTGYVSFADDVDVVELRIATSLIGVEQAKRNLEQEIAAEDTLEDVAARAQDAWDERLGVIEVEGASQDQLTTLYSTLYRLFLYPNSGHENVGTVAEPRYVHAVQSSGSWGAPPSTPTETGAEIADGKVYINNGFWDTHRAAWPAYSLLAPDLAGELVDGFVQQYRDGGWISPWSSPGYARVMTGTSSDAAFADAYAKQVPGLDVEDTYAAALKNATVRPTDDTIGRDGLEVSTFRGYAPNGSGGFSWSKDGYLNDFSLAEMAGRMAEEDGVSARERNRLEEESAYFRARSQGYVDLFDESVDFFQGRDEDGSWTTPTEDYDPRVWGNDHDYTESNGWNEAFPAPYDGQGLAELYGGREALADKLDEYFATPETADRPGSYGGIIHEMRETRDFRLGQWSIPNQVSYHIPWMYNYTQQPWKAQQQVRAGLSRGWSGSAIGQGAPGDEDNGANSGWWLMSALGLYPLQLGNGEYTIGSPLFERATLHLPGGDVVIEAPGTSEGDVFVQGLTVDGVDHGSTSIEHAELADGSVLRFEMGPEPSDWGTGADDVPGSVTGAGERPRPLHDVTGEGRGDVVSDGDVEALFDDTSETAAVLEGRDPVVGYDVNGGSQTEVGFYTLTSALDQPDLDPSSWVLQGSDDGRRWQTLDVRTREEFTWRGQTRPFELRRPARAEHYRLQVNGVGGQRSFQLAELELLTTDPVPEAALELAVEDVSLRAGGTAPVQVQVANTGPDPVTAELALQVPASWTAHPESVPVELEPGGSSTATFQVTAGADAPAGTRVMTAVARWDGWRTDASGRAQVVGDVTTIEPGTESEAAVLVADDRSQLSESDGRGVRFADEERSFVYRLPLPGDGSGGELTLDIANQFLVQVSTDRETWTTVLREPTAATFQGNRAERALDVDELRESAGGGEGALYLRFADSRPEDGWGAWLAGARLETTG